MEINVEPSFHNMDKFPTYILFRFGYISLYIVTLVAEVFDAIWGIWMESNNSTVKSLM